MSEAEGSACTAFHGTRRVAAGTLADVAAAVKPLVDREDGAPMLVFDDLTGTPIEVDFRGTVEEVRQRLVESAQKETPSAAAGKARGPGRPKLGVVAREVTLLPRHWEWLNRQPGGASVALRKLVEDARRRYAGRDRVRQSQDAAYRFMAAMAGNAPGFEEAARALFAGDKDRFEHHTQAWPADVRDHAVMLGSAALVCSADAS
jgi:hypothetical protein